jgi:hypothetical protein
MYFKIAITQSGTWYRKTNEEFISLSLSLLAALKSDIGSKDGNICHTKLLVKRAGFTV